MPLIFGPETKLGLVWKILELFNNFMEIRLIAIMSIYRPIKFDANCQKNYIFTNFYLRFKKGSCDNTSKSTLSPNFRFVSFG